MRVAVVTASYGTTYGGLQTCVTELVDGLRRCGAVVDVYALAECPDVGPGRPAEGRGTVRRYGFLGRGQFRPSPALLRDLRRRSGGYDLVHVYDAHTPMPLAAWLTGEAPVVLTPAYHGRSLVAVARRAHAALLAGAVRRASAVVCNSESERRLLAAHVPGVAEKTRVVIPGAQLPPRPSRPVRRERAHLLTVARQVAYKRTAALLDAVPLLPPEARLTVVGDGPEQRRLAARVERLRIGDQVQLTGWVNQGRLAELYAACGIYVTLSIRESLGMALVDALAAGMAVVASDIPAHREVLTRWGDPRRLVPVEGGPAAVAERIAAALNAAGDGVSPAAPTEPLPTWEQYLRGHEQVYRAVAGRRPRRGH